MSPFSFSGACFQPSTSIQLCPFPISWIICRIHFLTWGNKLVACVIFFFCHTFLLHKCSASQMLSFLPGSSGWTLLLSLAPCLLLPVTHLSLTFLCSTRVWDVFYITIRAHACRHARAPPQSFCCGVNHPKLMYILTLNRFSGFISRNYIHLKLW